MTTLARANSKWVGWPILGPVIAGWEEGFCAVRPSNLPCAGCEAVRHGRKTPGDYHTLAKTRGFAWHGTDVPDRQTPSNWVCYHGHTWAASYEAVARAGGCPHCQAGDFIAITAPVPPFWADRSGRSAGSPAICR